MVELQPGGEWTDVGAARVRLTEVTADAFVVGDQGPGEGESDEPPVGTDDLAFEPRIDRVLAETQTDVTAAVRFDFAARDDLIEMNIEEPMGQTPLAQVAFPAPPDWAEQIVLLSTPGGVLRWLLRPGDAGEDRWVYDIPRAVLGRSRGASWARERAVSTLIVRALRFVKKAFTGLAGAVSRRWESRLVRQRFRLVRPGDYADKYAPDLQDPDWATLTTGPVLLFVHGTFSSTHGALAHAPRSLVAECCQRYDGRVFAWDHRTVGPSPRDNVRWAAANIPEKVRMDVDIVAHSRGGLVARELAERPVGSLAGRIRVNNLVTLGSPHRGTPLADPRSIASPIDAITSLLLVSGQPGLALGVQLAKHAAIHGFKGAAGLTAMTPSGTYLRSLNAGSARRARRYVPVGAAFVPDQQSPVARVVRDLAFDQVFFGGEANDMVVPTSSAIDLPDTGFMDVYFRELDVCHSDFVRSPRLPSAVSAALRHIDLKQEAARAHVHGRGR